MLVRITSPVDKTLGLKVCKVGSVNISEQSPQIRVPEILNFCNALIEPLGGQNNPYIIIALLSKHCILIINTMGP